MQENNYTLTNHMNPICIIELYKAPVISGLMLYTWKKPEDFRPTGVDSKFRTVAIFRVRLRNPEMPTISTKKQLVLKMHQPQLLSNTRAEKNGELYSNIHITKTINEPL